MDVDVYGFKWQMNVTGTRGYYRIIPTHVTKWFNSKNVGSVTYSNNSHAPAAGILEMRIVTDYRKHVPQIHVDVPIQQLLLDTMGFDWLQCVCHV